MRDGRGMPTLVLQYTVTTWYTHMFQLLIIGLNLKYNNYSFALMGAMCHAMRVWSSGMILPSGGSGPEFDSPFAPKPQGATLVPF